MSGLPWLARDALTVVLALVAGMLSGSFSMGGQVLMKPGIRLLGASPLGTVGSTVPMILPTVAAATWDATSQAGVGALGGGAVGGPGRCDRRDRRVGARPSGARRQGHLLQVATATLMLFTADQDALARAPSRAGRLPERRGPHAPGPTADARGWAAVGRPPGSCLGCSGVGGGVLMVPGFSQLLAMPLLTAIATSLVCAGIFAIPATITHCDPGHDRVAFRDPLLIVGAVPGARLGARLAMRASDSRLEVAVGVMVRIIAITYAVGELYAWLG